MELTVDPFPTQFSQTRGTKYFELITIHLVTLSETEGKTLSILLIEYPEDFQP